MGATYLIAIAGTVAFFVVVAVVILRMSRKRYLSEASNSQNTRREPELPGGQSETGINTAGGVDNFDPESYVEPVTLRDPHPREHITDTPDHKDSLAQFVLVFRVFIGIIAFILLLIIYNNTLDVISIASYMEASAVQLIQLYSEALFQALIVTGGVLSLYIMSKFIR